jgi:hypothetical protein
MQYEMKNSECLDAVPTAVARSTGRPTWGHSQEAWKGPAWNDSTRRPSHSQIC